MNRKTGFQIAFTLGFSALIIMLFSSFSFADPIPYLKPTYIYVRGSYYVLNGDFFNCTMVVECDNAVIDGAGHTFQGASGLNRIATGIYLSGRKNVIIKNIIIDNYVTGIQLSECENITISNNSVSDCSVNIEMTHSNNSRIESNNVTGGVFRGIVFGACNNNSFTKNNIIGNSMGFMAEGDIWISSRYNTVIGNYIAENDFGISIIQGSNNRIEGNNITRNNFGISIRNSDQVIGNTFLDNNYGFQLHSENCTFYHNNFSNSSEHYGRHEWAVKVSPINSWDSGSEGNYWSDYNGIDANGDGIGDTPYTLDSNNTDNFPLMKPFGTNSSPLPSPTDVSYLYFAISVAAGVAFALSCLAMLFIKQRKTKSRKAVRFDVGQCKNGFSHSH